MNIEEILEKFHEAIEFLGCPECGCKEGQCTCDGECDCHKKDEAITEEKDLAEEPAKMEQAEYEEVKTVEPEVDTVSDTLAGKLLKQLEAFHLEECGAGCKDKEEDGEEKEEVTEEKVGE